MLNEEVRLIASILTEHPDVVNNMSEDDVLASINEIMAQPWQKWAKVERVDNREAMFGVDDDPGDYPSAAGLRPGRSSGYIEDINSEVEFNISDDLANLFDVLESDGLETDYNEFFDRNLCTVAEKHINADFAGISITRWDIKRDKNRVVFKPTRIDSSNADVDDYDNSW